MRIQPLADLLHPGLALLAVVGEGTHLDELVRVERAADLGHHLVGEALVADQHDRLQLVRLGAQLGALGGGEGGHGREYRRP
jgi:hypothetical protein